MKGRRGRDRTRRAAAVALAAALGAGLGPGGCAGPGEVAAGPRTPEPKGSADNSACLVCHLDFEAETLAAVHAKGGVGCVACHGPSEAHGGDEMNITAPDILFGRAEIDPFCTGCHASHEAGEAYRAFLARWSGKRRANGRMVSDASVCTDCHGEHAVLEAHQQVGPSGG